MLPRYLTELDRADREPATVCEGRVSHSKEKILGLKAQLKYLNQVGTRMRDAPDGQISLTGGRWTPVRSLEEAAMAE